ncbi:MAG: DUF3082 domain-containing protein [Cyanobacteriota bacterium]|nr:DUF3082 domain-containing protein [Cyanobacteriota bacterium]
MSDPAQLPEADAPAPVLPSEPESAASGLTPGDGTPVEAERADAPRKGPLSFLSGAITSSLLAWLCFGLSRRVVQHYALHPPHYSAPVAQSIATAVKTLVVGMCFLATFSFAFIGVGLLLTFVRSLLPASPADPA